MENKLAPDDEYFTRFFRRFIKRQNSMLKIYDEILSSFQIEFDSLQANNSGTTKQDKYVKVFDEFQSIQKRFFKYFETQANPEYAIEDVLTKMPLYYRLPKKELVTRFATTAYEHELLHQEIIYLSAAVLFFQKKLTTSNINEIQNNSNRQKNVKLREDKNRACLIHSLTLLKNKVQRPLEGTDFAKFIKIVNDTYPVQPAPKKARLTKEEKQLPKNLQDEILKEKQSDKWKPSSLRKFFEDSTGLIATTKK